MVRALGHFLKEVARPIPGLAEGVNWVLSALGIGIGPVLQLMFDLPVWVLVAGPLSAVIVLATFAGIRLQRRLDSLIDKRTVGAALADLKRQGQTLLDEWFDEFLSIQGKGKPEERRFVDRAASWRTEVEHYISTCPQLSPADLSLFQSDVGIEEVPSPYLYRQPFDSMVRLAKIPYRRMIRLDELIRRLTH